ncbi:50S ribosomal protein L25/general stress protein Ctc [Thermodesulfobacteriota bacterium]
MALIELKSNIRTSVGKGKAKALRREKRVPAVLYGPETDPVLLSVNMKDLDHVMKNSSAGQLILNLVVQNGESYTKTTMVKELQIHPVSRNFLHVDFYEVSMDRKLKVKVPVVIKGKAKGVELGGMLQILRHELEVLCLPLEVPESIEVDVTDLDMGDSIHIEDISLAGNIEFSEESNFTVVTILTPTIEEEPVEEEEEEDVEALAEGEEPAETVEEE